MTSYKGRKVKGQGNKVEIRSYRQDPRLTSSAEVVYDGFLEILREDAFVKRCTAVNLRGMSVSVDSDIGQTPTDSQLCSQ